ncbi:translation machinery-associated protein 16 [Coemansia aciculifera]|nr:translation machinery-associated protein 16 [Coemansia aciculifera]
MDLFLANLAGSAHSLALPASLVVNNIRVAAQGDYTFEHVQVFEATFDKLSLFSVLCLLKALPALTELRCGISGLGSELEDIAGKKLPDHIASTYRAIGQNMRVWHIPSTNDDDDANNIIECIVLLALVCPKFRRVNVAQCGIRNFDTRVAKPNNKRKRVSKIKDKEKAHPYSRKARQINRAMHKETHIAKAKSERINMALGRGQKIVWFRDNMDKGEEDVDAKLKKKVWTMVELRQLVDVYLARNDEEIETILAKKEEGKNLLQKESLFLQLVDSEVKEAKLAGVEVPDLTNGAVVKALRAWDGDLNSITTIKLVTCKPASIIPIEEEAKSSRRGDSASAKADKIPQLLTEQQAIEIATGMVVN